VRTTIQSEVFQITDILLKHARSAFCNQTKLSKEWQSLNYVAEPSYDIASQEYDEFARLISHLGIMVHYVPFDDSSIDSIYLRDASVLTDRGAILCRMGKAARRGEQRTLGQAYHQLEIEILGEIEAPGMLEGGDTMWLRPDLLAVGRTYRSNESGIAQLKSLAANYFEIMTVDLPHYKGPSDVFHLMSVVSPLDVDLLLVYSPLLTVRFREWLISNGFNLIEVPEEEFESMGINVLTIAPRVCMLLSGNPKTKARLTDAGCQVVEFSGNEISGKGLGGPTCLTRPLWRKYPEEDLN
jgi:N-dimethylarginine dimethylaminohydrolase